MADLYCYDETNVLKNKLDIRDEKTLNLIEAEQSRMEMLLLYDSGFNEFSVSGFYKLHEKLFSYIYDWAGQPRIVNLIKKESILCGKSVWYSDSDNIAKDLENAFKELNSVNWEAISKEDFIKQLVPKIASIWQIHPFREGNTRTTVIFMILFIESFGYYVDKELLSKSAGYVRNSLVLASFNENSEYEHLERILFDAVRIEETVYDKYTIVGENNELYEKYDIGHYEVTAHEVTTEKYEI